MATTASAAQDAQAAQAAADRIAAEKQARADREAELAAQQTARSEELAAAAEQPSPVVGDASTLPTLDPYANPYGGVERARQELEAKRQEQLGILASLPGPVRIASKIYPLVAERAGEYFGQGQPQQFVPEPFVPEKYPRFEGESDRDYAARINTAQAGHQITQGMAKLAFERKQAEAVKTAPPVSLGTVGQPGMMAGMRGAAEGVAEAQIRQATAISAAQEQAALQQGRAARAMLDLEKSRRDERERLGKAFSQYDHESQQALNELNKAPETAADVFRGMGKGAQVAAALGMIAGGWLAGAGKGSGTQMVDLMSRIASERNEARKTKWTAANMAAEKKRDWIERKVSLLGNEQASDLYTQKLVAEAGAAEIRKAIAQTTVPTAKANLHQELVGLETHLRDIGNQLKTQLALTPQSTVVDPYAGARRQARAAIREIEKADTGIIAKGYADAFGQASKQHHDWSVEEFKTKAQSMTGEGGTVKQAQFLAKEVAPYIGVNLGIDSFIERHQSKDVAGRGTGLATYFWSEDGRAVREDIMEIMQRQLRSESGAVLSDEEIERRFNSAYSGIGDNEMMRNLERLKTANSRFIQGVGAAVTDETWEYYQDNLARRTGQSRGVAAVGSGDVDADAEALGGKRVGAQQGGGVDDIDLVEQANLLRSTLPGVEPIEKTPRGGTVVGPTQSLPRAGMFTQ